MAVAIEIKGKKYPVKFGYGAFRYLGALWNCKGMTEVINKLSALDGMGEAFSFEQGDVLSDLVLAGIRDSVGEDEDIWRDQVMDAILENPEIMILVMAELMRSFPQPKADAKPAAKGKKKKI